MQQPPESPVPRETSPFVSQHTQESSLSGNSNSEPRPHADALFRLKIKSMSGKIVARISLSRTVHRFGSANDKLEIRLRLRGVNPIHGALFADSKGVFVYPYDDSVIKILRSDGSDETVSSAGRRLLPYEVLNIAGLRFLFELEDKPVDDDLWGTAEHPIPPESFSRSLQEDFCAAHGLNRSEILSLTAKLQNTSNQQSQEPLLSQSQSQSQSQSVQIQSQPELPAKVTTTVKTTTGKEVTERSVEVRKPEVKAMETSRREEKKALETKKETFVKKEEIKIPKVQRPLPFPEGDSPKKAPMLISPPTSPRPERPCPSVPRVIEPSRDLRQPSAMPFQPFLSTSPTLGLLQVNGFASLTTDLGDNENGAMGRQERQEGVPYCTSPARGPTKGGKLASSMGFRRMDDGDMGGSPQKRQQRKTRLSSKEQVAMFVQSLGEERERRRLEMFEAAIPQSIFTGSNSRSRSECDDDTKEYTKEHKKTTKSKQRDTKESEDEGYGTDEANKETGDTPDESKERSTNNRKTHKSSSQMQEEPDNVASEDNSKSSRIKKEHKDKHRSTAKETKTTDTNSTHNNNDGGEDAKNGNEDGHNNEVHEDHIRSRRRSRAREEIDYLNDGVARGVGGSRTRPLLPDEDGTGGEGEGLPHKKMSLSREFDLLAGNLRI